MPNLTPLEAGVVFWGERDSLAEIRALGVRCGQLVIPGGMKLGPDALATWKADDFAILTVFAAYEGEDYADIPTVQRTVGFVPPATREARERRTLEISDFARDLGVDSIACHIGCVPEDSNHPDYVGVRDLVRRICDHAAGHGQTFALETGQEPAGILLRFIVDVDRPNLRINFDPANMVLYGSGDPIEALRQVGHLVSSVHAKDGDWPPTEKPGALGTERPLGQGAVGIERFVRTLQEIEYSGALNVEREIEDQQQRLTDIAGGLALLRSLTSSQAHTSE
jgi:sugar phosphate isomerase/epimerase